MDRDFQRILSDYEHIRKRTVFDKVELPVDRIKRQVGDFGKWAATKGYIKSRKEIKSLDCIDFSKVVDARLEEATMPAMELTQAECEAADDCWYLIVPPLMNGVLRINRGRYFEFEITGIYEENHSYSFEIFDYACEYGSWIMENKISGFIGWDLNYEYSDRQPGSLNPHLVHIEKGEKIGEIMERLALELSGWSEDELLFFNKVTIPRMKQVGKEDDFGSVVVHFALAVIRTNMQLMQGRPKPVRGMGRKVNPVIGDEKPSKPQVVRALSNGIEIKSVKVPKVMTGELVRRYSLAAWNTRGHIRRYKNGKTVWIKPSVHHRKCLMDEKAGDDISVPQTVIEVTGGV